MSFVMIATGASSSAGVRTVSVRALVSAALLAAVMFVALGAGLGYWLGVTLPAALGGHASAGTGSTERAKAVLPFTLEQLGAISARVFQLENQAAHLSQRIGALQASPASAPAGTARTAKPGAGSGGPMLPPRNEVLTDFTDLQARLAQVEQRFSLVSDAAVQRSLAMLRFPSRVPLKTVELSSEFGNREDPFTHRLAFHPGLDFVAPTGTPIRAAAGGVVSFAGPRAGYGNMVEIDHGNGLSTRYGHASRLLVKPGMVVAPGDEVALVGSTGRSTGPHLHFEVLHEGEQIDPRRYLAGLTP